MNPELERERRITRLEAESENRDRQIEKMSEKLDAMYDLFMQAKGARWALITAAGIGGAIAGFATKFIPWTGALPK